MRRALSAVSLIVNPSAVCLLIALLTADAHMFSIMGDSDKITSAFLEPYTGNPVAPLMPSSNPALKYDDHPAGPKMTVTAPCALAASVSSAVTDFLITSAKSSDIHTSIEIQFKRPICGHRQRHRGVDFQV